jgi:hypothetical protein
MSPGRSKAALVALGTLLIGSAALLFTAQAQLTFIYDDWYFLLERRGSDGSALLDPYNEHIVVAQAALYKGLLGAFGIDSARPLQIAHDTAVLLCGALLFVHVRRRLGDWAGLLAAALVLFCGAAWLDLLWQVNVALSGGCAAGLAALLALDRDDRAGDAAAVALLVVSVLFSEVGVAFTIGAAVVVATGPRHWGDRLFVPLLPLLLYGVWWLEWGQQADSSFSLDNVVSSPGYVFDAISQGLAALLGLAVPLSGRADELTGLGWGRALLAIVLVAAVAVALRRRRPGATPPERAIRPAVGLWAVLTAGLAFWFLAAFNENELRPATNARLLLPTGVFILLIATEALRGARLTRTDLLGATAVAVFALVMGLRAFDDGAEVLENTSAATRADLTALELASEANPNFLLTRDLDYPWLLPVSTGDYQAAVADYDSTPAYSERELGDATAEAQAGADRVLAAALGLTLEPASSKRPQSSCRAARASDAIRTGIRFGPGTLTLAPSPAARAQVLLARFSETYWSVNLGAAEGGRSVQSVIPGDRSLRPWELGLRGSGRFLVCAGGAPTTGG